MTKRLYEIWLAGMYVRSYDEQTPRSRRAEELFYLRTGEDVLSYHVRICMESMRDGI